MTFLTLPVLAVLAGLAAIALSLFLLQQLRTRNAQVVVPTLMFWRASVRDAPVRVLRDRFRHLWAYLLCLAICTLIWIAFADPATDTDEQINYHVLFLDGSAHTSNPDDFEVARQQLLSDLRDFPEHKREVFFGTATTLKVLTTGEHYRIAERRLHEVTPEGSNSTLGEFVRLLNAADRFPQGTQLIVYGKVPIDDALRATLPDDVTLVQRAFESNISDNIGITSLGWANSSTGSWSQVDVFFEIEGTGETIGEVAFTVFVGDEEVPPEAIHSLTESSYLIKELPANGSVLTVALDSNDFLDVDNEARLQLPTKRPIKVNLDGTIHESIVQAIRADPGLELVDTDEDVRVLASTSADLEVPSLQLDADTDRQKAIQYVCLDGDDIAAIRQRTLDLGFDRIENTPRSGKSTVLDSIGFEEGTRRRISLAERLLHDDVGFRDSYTFPLYIASAIRWLADEKAQFSYAAAGRPLIAHNQFDSLAISNSYSSSVLGADFIPARTETLDNVLGDSLEVALLDPQVTSQSTVDAHAIPDEDTGVVFSGFGSIGLWLTLLAIAFLAFEWYLYQRRLMP